MQQVIIQIRGHLDPDWQEWFEGFSIHQDNTSNTLIEGSINDQTTLYTLLNKLGRLGIQLQKVTITEIESPSKKPAGPRNRRKRG